MDASVKHGKRHPIILLKQNMYEPIIETKIHFMRRKRTYVGSILKIVVVVIFTIENSIRNFPRCVGVWYNHFLGKVG
jgi:hypothetical protein